MPGRRPWGRDEEWGFGPHQSQRRRGRQRRFDAEELRLLLLHLIHETPRHGYELIAAVEALTQGAYAPSPGMVYPALTMLRDMGHIEEVQSDGTRKRYSATEAGQARLQEGAEQVAQLVERLQQVAQGGERVEAAPVRRAMRNLKEALADKFTSAVSRDKALEIAAIIDAAAQQIERL